MAHEAQGGLPELNFEGLSLHEMAMQLSSLGEARRNRSAQAHSQHSADSPSRCGTESSAGATAAPVDPLNTSDLFNSRDELVLNRLSEWTDSDPEDNDDAKSDASDASSASTESIEVSVLKPEHPKVPPFSLESIMNVSSVSSTSTGFFDMMANNFRASQPAPTSTTASPSKIVEIEDQCDGDISDLLGWTAKESEVSSGAFKAKFHPVPNYGCRVSPGFGYQGLNVLKPSASSGWRIIPGTEDDQIFTRAPNFRTPGGYKPPLFEKEPRDLSDTQISDEVQQMYAEAAAEKELDAQILPKIKVPTQVRFSHSETRADQALGQGDSNTPQQHISQRQPATPSSAKRKLFVEKVNGDGDTGTEDPPLPDLNLGLTDFPEIDEPLVTRGRSYLCADMKIPQVVTVSPSKAPLLELSSRYTGDISRCLPRRSSASQYLSPEARKVNLLELDRLWKDIQDTKHKMEQDMQSIRNADDPFLCRPSTSGTRSNEESRRPSSVSKQPLSPILKSGSESGASKLIISPNKFIEPLPLPKTPTKVTFNDPAQPPPLKAPSSASSKSRPKKLTKRTGSKGKRMQAQKKVNKPNPNETTVSTLTACTDEDEEELRIPFLPKQLEDMELSTLLKETDLEQTDLDEMLSHITEFHPPGHLMDEKDSPFELTDALQQLQISDWAKAGAGEYVEKFYEEKYKRQHCEKEILGLQKKLLGHKERVAVLEGVLKTKEFTVHKYTKLWEGLVKQWRNHEKSCKANTSKLESQNASLKMEVDSSKTRISEYEKELGKAVQLGTDFRTEIDQVMKSTEKDREDWKAEKEALHSKLEQLVVALSEGKSEKEATMRALRECQSSLDQTRTEFQSTVTEVDVLRLQSSEDSSRIAKLIEDKDSLESHFSQVLKEKKTTETALSETKLELEEKKRDKELLESKLRAERERMREDSERLHDYYNSKMREILNSQSQKVVEAEKLFIQSHENRLRLVQEEAEARFTEMRDKYRQEIHLMSGQFSSDIETLRRDSEEKGKLIVAVSRQLRTFSEKDSSRDVSLYLKQGHALPKPHVLENSASADTEGSPKRNNFGAGTSSQASFQGTNDEMSQCISSLVYAYNEKKFKKQHRTNGHPEPT